MTLFSLCLEFVASNIHLVESFIGFPDAIGKMIFDESIRTKIFTNIKDSYEAKANLKVFFDAYGDFGILTSLSLQQSHLFVNDAINVCPWLLKHITSLDLSFCGLGDSHELLPYITSCQRLEVLNLHANCLTDDGIRSLTTPLRFHGRDHCLKIIDLSSNSVTTKCLHFLKIFNALCVMDVSDTSITQIGSLKKGFNLSPHNSCSCCDSLSQVTTKGWAKEVVDSWKQDYKTCTSSISQPASPTAFAHSLPERAVTMDAKAFYSRQKCAPKVVQSKFEGRKCATNKLILVTELFHCPHTKGGTFDSTDHVRNQKWKTFPSPFSSCSPFESTLSLYTDNDTLKKSGGLLTEPPPNHLRTSRTSIDHRDHGGKRKPTHSVTSQEKRFCFLTDGLKGNIAVAEEIKKKRTYNVCPTTTSNALLALYSEADQGKETSLKRNLVEELENLY